MTWLIALGPRAATPLIVWLVFGFTPATAAVPTSIVQPDTVVRTPSPGSLTRRAMLDAIRAHVGVTSPSSSPAGVAASGSAVTPCSHTL